MSARHGDDRHYFHGGPLGKAGFKVHLEDFVVEELLGFEPSGVGEHCLVWVEKRGLDSNVVSTRLADALGIRRRLVSHCGLKDRHAITRQWFSIHLPGRPSPEASTLESEGLRVHRVTRNARKLRRGIHAGNRFTIRLREPNFDPSLAAQRWDAITRLGVPNVFGPQRFGHGGQNVVKALAMFRGEFETRDRLLRGLLLSAARSQLFNEFVFDRMARGQWDTPLEGEIYGFADNRSIILPERQRGDEADRLRSGTLELTAPLWGRGELQTTGQVRIMEQGIADRYLAFTSGLEAFSLRQERRVIRLRPTNSVLSVLENGDIELGFDLPKGTYATALIREFVEMDKFHSRIDN